MEQRHSQEPEHAFDRNRTLDEKAFSARIDPYLDRVCLPLTSTLPEEEAAEVRAEMRTHLEGLVEAYQELGASEPEAIAQAIAQFGKEQRVTQAWKQECEATHAKTDARAFWSAMRPIVGYSTLNWLLFPLLAGLYSFVINTFYHAGATAPKGLLWLALIVFLGEYTLVPALLGGMAGRRTRGKALVACLLWLPLVYHGSLLFTNEVYWCLHLFQPPPGAEYYSHPLNVLEVAAPSALYLGFGTIGAAFTALRRKRKARPASS